ncbi:MAG: S4 domain-containing protein [Alphaproteobacteria bacterium]
MKNIDTKNNIEMSEQRIDNWLYRVRLAKTRSISQRIIKEGNIRINKYKIYKPSIKIKSGDIITINLNKQTLVVLVNGFTKRRLGYKSAQEHYKVL